MNKTNLLLAAALLLTVPASAQTETEVIGKHNIKLTSDRMTPEALWAMGRIGSYQASPDGKQIVYQVGYYSVKQNKSHQVLYVMDADGKNQRKLTLSSKSEVSPAWIEGGTRIAFLSGGQIWSMLPDGTDRRQLPASRAHVAPVLPALSALLDFRYIHPLSKLYLLIIELACYSASSSAA